MRSLIPKVKHYHVNMPSHDIRGSKIVKPANVDDLEAERVPCLPPPKNRNGAGEAADGEQTPEKVSLSSELVEGMRTVVTRRRLRRQQLAGLR